MSLQSTTRPHGGQDPSLPFSQSLPILPEYQQNDPSWGYLAIQALSLTPTPEARLSFSLMEKDAKRWNELSFKQKETLWKVRTLVLEFMGNAERMENPASYAYIKPLKDALIPLTSPYSDNRPPTMEIPPPQILMQGQYPETQREALSQAEAAALKDIRAAQTSKVCEFANLFLEHYILPSLSQDGEDDLLFRETFAAILPSLVDKYFFNKPDGLTSQIKTLILHIFRSLKIHLADYNLQKKTTRLGQNHQPTFKRPNVASALELAEFIVLDAESSHAVASKPVTHQKPTTTPQHTNSPATPSHNLRKYLETTILQSMAAPADPLNKISALVTSKFLMTGMKFLSSPYFLCLVVDRVLNETFEVDSVPTEKIADEIIAPRDKAFSEQMGELLHAITDQVISMGRPTGAMEGFADFGKAIMKKKSTAIGAHVQTALSRVLNSEGTMMPILFLDAFLFKTEEGKKVPTMLGSFGKSDEEMQAFQAAIELTLSEQFYKTLRRLIKNQAPPGVSPLITTVNRVETFLHTIKRALSNTKEAAAAESSIKAFCRTLVESLYLFAKDEMVHVFVSVADAVRLSYEPEEPKK